jgi:single-strand DNA-binding protein
MLQTEEGSTKYTTEIQVTEFTFLTTKKESEPFKPSNTENASGLPENDMPF